MLVRFITVMAGSGPHEISPPHAESVNVHLQCELHNLEHGNHVDNQQEGSSQTLHAGRSGYRRRSHLVHEQADEKDLQREIEDLKKKLRRAQRNKPLLALMFLPTMKEMPVTGNAQKPHLVNLILMRKNILIRGGERAHLGEGWELRS